MSLTGFVVEGGADLFDVGAVDADGFVELVAGNAKLLSPIVDIGRHLGIDLFRIVGTGLGLSVLGVGSAKFGLLNFFVLMRACWIGMRHWFVPLFTFS